MSSPATRGVGDDPHTEQVRRVEDEDGQPLGAATPLDTVANVHRRQRKSKPTDLDLPRRPARLNGVELAYRHYHNREAASDKETR